MKIKIFIVLCVGLIASAENNRKQYQAIDSKGATEGLAKEVAKKIKNRFV